MKKNVVFIMPMYFGHLNKTILIAKLLETQGYAVFYAGSKQLLRFVITHKFKLYLLETRPFTYEQKTPLSTNKFKKWYDLVIRDYFVSDFLARQKELEKLVNELDPAIIFLDEFYYSDFINLYPFQENCRIFILQTKFGLYYNPYLPPPTYFAFPGTWNKIRWKKIFLKQWFNRILNNAVYLGNGSHTLIAKALKWQHIPDNYSENKNKILTSGFKNVPELLLVPQELEFEETKVDSWIKYFGPSTDMNRKEIVSPNLKEFLNRKAQRIDSKLVYCTLGTVSNIHLKNELKIKQEFFKNLIELAKCHPDYYFIIGLGDDLKIEEFSSDLPENFLIMHFAPQIYILKQADLMYTHAGQNSIFESILAGLPMLLFPLNNLWEHNGTCARMVHHQLGIKASLTDNSNFIWSCTQELLNNPKYKKSVLKMAEMLKDKYTDAYLLEILEEPIENKNEH